MGTDFKCGCRTSMGGWYLCKTHENYMFTELGEELNDMEPELGEKYECYNCKHTDDAEKFISNGCPKCKV